MDLMRTITYNRKKLYEVNESTTNINEVLQQMNVTCNNSSSLNDLEKLEGTIYNVQKGINNTYDRKNFKDQNLHYFAVIAVLTDTPREDVSKDQEEKA